MEREAKTQTEMGTNWGKVWISYPRMHVTEFKYFGLFMPDLIEVHLISTNGDLSLNLNSIEKPW